MSRETHQTHVSAVIDLIGKQKKGLGRIVIAIAGPPASGKTTLAHSVVERLNLESQSATPIAALLPMDGYHLDNEELESLGLLSRKGAVETFDQDAFCADLHSVSASNLTLSLPEFDRDLDRVIPKAITISPEVEIVIAEGNYLLLDQQPWAGAAHLYAATVFVEASIDILRERLIERWADHGIDPRQAHRKVEHNDLPNARLILDCRLESDLIIRHVKHDALVLEQSKFEQGNFAHEVLCGHSKFG